MKKPPKVHGRVVDGILYKTAKQAKKFWKHEGYGVAVADTHNVQGIVIQTQYDGKLYTNVPNLEEHGIAHTFIDPKGKEEKQLILPVQYWREVR